MKLQTITYSEITFEKKTRKCWKKHTPSLNGKTRVWNKRERTRDNETSIKVQQSPKTGKSNKIVRIGRKVENAETINERNAMLFERANSDREKRRADRRLKRLKHRAQK